MTVSDTIGLPTSYPYTLAIDYDNISEELVDVTNAAGSLLTITRGVDGTSATLHNAGARVRHTSSARDFADSRNHENADDGIHGLDPGEEIVGTDKAQTLTNKTVVNLAGSLLNPDINLTGANTITTTRTPAGVGTATAFELVNGTDQTLVIQNDGDIRIRNNAAMDTATTTRRLQFTMSDGTTERMYVDATGMLTSIPRAGTSAAFGGFKALEPGDNNSRRMIQIKNSADAVDHFLVFASGATQVINRDGTMNSLMVFGGPGQSVNILEVKTSASADLFTVGSTGEVNANNRLDVSNGTAGQVVVQVKGAPGQTADLQDWETNTGANLAKVRANGEIDCTANVATSGTFTPAAGWTVANQTAIIKAGTLTHLINLNRTGADIVAGGDGNIADVNLGTVAAAWRPHTGFGANSLTSAATTGVGTGSVRLFADTGDYQLVTWSSGGTLATGAVLTITMTYPLPFT